MKKIMTAIAALACTFASVADDKTGCNLSRGDVEGESVGIWLPLGLSILTPPIQLPRTSYSVYGVMVNVGYGQVRNLAVADVGIVNNVTGTVNGFEVGPVNIAGTCHGVQAGAVNVAGTCCGVQAGIVNVASKTAGVQVGALNFTGDLHGLQLGVLNFSRTGGALVFPIFNIGF